MSILHQLTPTQRRAAERSRAFHASISARAAERLQAPPRVVEIKAACALPASPPPPAPTQELPPQAFPAEPDPPKKFTTPEDLGVVRDYPSVAKIQNFICDRHLVSRAELLTRYRAARYVHARHVAFYLCRMLTPFSYPELGRRFGGMDHTSILHGVVKIASRIESDPDFAAEIDAYIQVLSPDDGVRPVHVERSPA